MCRSRTTFHFQIHLGQACQDFTPLAHMRTSEVRLTVIPDLLAFRQDMENLWISPRLAARPEETTANGFTYPLDTARDKYETGDRSE